MKTLLKIITWPFKVLRSIVYAILDVISVLLFIPAILFYGLILILKDYKQVKLTVKLLIKKIME